MSISFRPQCVNKGRPRPNERYFADDIFKCIFLNENVWIPIKISLKFVPSGPINNIPAMVQIMAWCRPGDKPLSEQMLVSLLTHICVAGPQCVKHCTGFVACITSQVELRSRFGAHNPTYLSRSTYQLHMYILNDQSFQPIFCMLSIF